MIVVRDTFEIEPAGMKTAREVLREALPLGRKLNYPIRRVLTDLVGSYYTLVLESEFPDLGSFEASLEESFQSPEWQTMYGKLRPLIRGGRREVFRLLE